MVLAILVPCLLLFSICANADPQSAELRELEARALVDSVNSANVGWQAELYPKFARLSPEQRRFFNGLVVPEGKMRESEERKRNREKEDSVMNIDTDSEGAKLPEQFDPRERWPECAEVIQDIRDQSQCGSCWAVAAAGALSDRLCISSAGKRKLSMSDIDTASCSMPGFDGCLGAPDLSPAWLFFHRSGVVTGSNFTLQQGCKPYPFPPSQDANDTEKGFAYRAPICTKQCQKTYQDRTYAKDKLFTGPPIVLSADDNKVMEQLLKQELYANGSVEVGFLVYSDFFYYKSGIYKQTWGSPEGGHAVRLVGWGVEGGVPYWLVANSWGHDWGEKGFFRIRRGTNEANIEGFVDAYAASIARQEE